MAKKEPNTEIGLAKKTDVTCRKKLSQIKNQTYDSASLIRKINE